MIGDWLTRSFRNISRTGSLLDSSENMNLYLNVIYRLSFVELVFTRFVGTTLHAGS